MANTASARKAARQAEQRRQHNTSLRSELKTAVKKVRSAIDAGNKQAAQAAFTDSQSVIDAMAAKAIIHRNKSARTKSRLVAAIKSMG